MADPATTPGDTPDRRDRRRDAKRRRGRRAVSVVGSVLLVAAVGLLATDMVRFGGDKPSLAGTIQATGSDDESPAATTTTGARNCRPLSANAPLRLWVGGDSLAGSLGPSLGKLAGETGVVQPYFDSRVSSGLADPGFFDWPDHATTEMARLDPDVAVFIIGTNDWTAVSGDWKDAYTAKVDAMMKTLIGSGRTVYWLGGPTIKDEKTDAGVVEVNAVAQEVAKRHPKVHYVDTYKLFSDTDGTFAYDLPIEDGSTVTVRSGDGIHFTMDGADYLARQVYKLVDAQCGLTQQKVDGATKQTIETEGSTQVAPNASSSNNSNSSGSSGNSGGTIQTTPPATSPPATSPPDTTPITEPPPATTAPSTTVSIPTPITAP
ncbi:MAG TPA: DUF459 domain-containing protein [Acidimicrobiia bacterium]|jgi:hypothetical protein